MQGLHSYVVIFIVYPFYPLYDSQASPCLYDPCNDSNPSLDDSFFRITTFLLKHFFLKAFLYGFLIDCFLITVISLLLQVFLLLSKYFEYRIFRPTFFLVVFLICHEFG